MQKAIKLVSVVAFLTASFPLLAQQHTMGTEAKRSSRRTMTIEPKLREEMMTTASNSDDATAAAEREELGAQVRGLARSIEELRQEIVELRHQLENSPQYLDQTNHSLWP